MFVLFLIFIRSGSVTSTTAYFGDEDACVAAEHTMGQELNALPLNPHPVFYLHCQPTKVGAVRMPAQPRP
jgi:hypothetical protein